MMIADATIMATTFGFAAGDIAGDVNDSVSIFNKTLAGGLGMAPGSKAGRLPRFRLPAVQRSGPARRSRKGPGRIRFWHFGEIFILFTLPQID
jgi:hypothetical protein